MLVDPRIDGHRANRIVPSQNDEMSCVPTELVSAADATTDFRKIQERVSGSRFGSRFSDSGQTSDSLHNTDPLRNSARDARVGDLTSVFSV
jgi:hypothetical protein